LKTRPTKNWQAGRGFGVSVLATTVDVLARFRRFVRASQEAGVASAIRLIGKIAKPKMRNQAALNITMWTELDPDKEV
jgi:hypothetical protein